MTSIRCVVERVTFVSPETGFAVLKVSMEGAYGAPGAKDDLVALVGNFGDIAVGTVLSVQGEWKMDAKYGRQFSAQKWEETMPATAYGIEKYLGSGLIRGVGPSFARKIVAAFGTDTLRVIEEEPARLREIDGLGGKRIAQIVESWEKQKEVKNIMLFLQSHDVSSSYAVRIYKTYGNKSLSVVRENPYRLADDIWGIGFRTADTIAQKLGMPKDSYVRIRAGILYTLSQMADRQGHVYVEHAVLVEEAAKILTTPEQIVDTGLVVMSLDQMISQEDVKTELLEADLLPDEAPHRAVYLPPFYHAEIGVASRLRKILMSPSRALPEINMQQLEAMDRIQYDEVQQQAIRQALHSKVMVLTGGPGTGKSTTTQGIIHAMQASKLRICLAAPTGRAAKRMSEVTGMEAKTIHRLLEYKPMDGYQRNDQNPIDADVLIVDECSMIDLILMNALLRAVPLQARLILVGDTDQLPSVGAGNVLKDIIASTVVPVVELKRIFRQAQTSRIIMNAHRINHGTYPDVCNRAGSDFFMIEKETPEEAASEIVELVARRLPGYFHMAPGEIQVLTPMQKGAAGAATLNQQLQERLNAGNAAMSLTRAGTSYRLQDKVMQIRNNYEKDVYNGDIGIIVSVDPGEGQLTVRYDDRPVTYDASELDELVLAYATTIHKAQGAEYPVIVMPVLMSHFIMLQRNLIYTGITRARKAVVIVGSRKALAYAIRNEVVGKRNTLLAKRLQGPMLSSGPNQADPAPQPN